jgi:hypothetical protein
MLKTNLDMHIHIHELKARVLLKLIVEEAMMEK